MCSFSPWRVRIFSGRVYCDARSAAPGAGAARARPRSVVDGDMRADRIDHARAPCTMRPRSALAQRGQHARRRARTPSVHPQGRGRRPTARDRDRRVRGAAVEQHRSAAWQHGWDAGSRRGGPGSRRRGDRPPCRLVPGAPGRVHRRDARSGRPLPGFPALDTFLTDAASATLRVTEVSGVVHGFDWRRGLRWLPSQELRETPGSPPCP
jgi:hypothetical protein